jgi:hypothetical protein
MSKKIAMTTRPQAAVSPQADKWVSDEPPAAEPEEVNAFISQRVAEAEQQGRAS